MERLELFKETLQKARQFQNRFPLDQAIVVLITQLEYLIEVEAGACGDRSKVGEVPIGILALREIETDDPALAQLLFQVDAEARRM